MSGRSGWPLGGQRFGRVTGGVVPASMGVVPASMWVDTATGIDVG